VNLAVAEHGAFDTWDWKTEYSTQERDEFFKKYFLPYLNTVKFCSAQNPNSGCFPDVTYKLLNGNSNLHLDSFENPKVVLADGTSVMLEFRDYTNRSKINAHVYVDINGNKKPNVRGLDYHIFTFYAATGEFLPYGVYMDNLDNGVVKRPIEDIYQGCSDKGNGVYCAVRIIMDGFKMNY